MLTQYLSPVGTNFSCLHNTSRWQVSSLMGGLCVELLFKERVVSADEQARLKLSLHDCYPEVFIQGEPAAEFLDELTRAQAHCSEKEVDYLLLDAYRDTALQSG